MERHNIASLFVCIKIGKVRILRYMNAFKAHLLSASATRLKRSNIFISPMIPSFRMKPLHYCFLCKIVGFHCTPPGARGLPRPGRGRRLEASKAA